MITSARAKVDWTTFGHTEQPVMTKAVGPGEKLFSGSYDNTDIAKKIAEILNLSLPSPGAGKQIKPRLRRRPVELRPAHKFQKNIDILKRHDLSYFRIMYN